jgi:hypothetical protein
VAPQLVQAVAVSSWRRPFAHALYSLRVAVVAALVVVIVVAAAAISFLSLAYASMITELSEARLSEAVDLAHVFEV